MKMTQKQVNAVVEAYKKDPKSVWCLGAYGCKDFPTMTKTVDELKEQIESGGFYEVRKSVAPAVPDIPSLMAKCAEEFVEWQKEICGDDECIEKDCNVCKKDWIKNWRPDENKGRSE